MANYVENLLINGGFQEGLLAGLAGNAAVLTVARSVQATYRARVGYDRKPAPVLTPPGSQVKLAKSEQASYGLMLMPERGLMAEEFADIREEFGIDRPVNLCQFASPGCAAACLSRSGQSGMRPAQRAQAVRTAFLLAFPGFAGALIGNEIRRALRRHGAINLRLNTTSDIRWEVVMPEGVAALVAAGVKLYDYTAWPRKARKLPAGYTLTYSAKEPAATSDEYLRGVLADGGNVAMPFTTGRGQALPETWHGFPVIDGDESDERYRDPRGVVVGLRAKGHEWKRDNTAGFIRQAN